MAERPHIAPGFFYSMNDSCQPYRTLSEESFYSDQHPTWASIDPHLASGVSVPYLDPLQNSIELQNQVANFQRCFTTTKSLYPAPLAPRNSMYEQAFQQEWPIHMNGYSRSRYMSPSGPIGGSLSEASSPSAYTSSSPNSIQYLRPSVSPNMLPSSLPQAFNGHNLPQQYLPWDVQGTLEIFARSASPPKILESSVNTQKYSMYPPKDMVFDAEQCIAFEDTLQDEENLQEGHEILKVAHRPSLRAPEEVLSVSEEAITSSTTTRIGSLQPQEQSTTATVEFDEDEEDMDETNLYAVDDRASDVDWTSKPTRAHKPRHTTKSASNRKDRSSRASLAQPNLKTGTPRGGNSRNAVHTRTPSRTSQGKTTTRQRLPPFAVNHCKKSTARQERSFPCAFRLFGCESCFANKNEWKRHVASQHLQLGYYRCDLGSCHPSNTPNSPVDDTSSTTSTSRHGRRPSSRRGNLEVLIFNDFNRKDLFTQHCRRMHGPQRTASQAQSSPQKHNRKNSQALPHVSKEEEAAFESELVVIRERCWRVRRKAPNRSFCGFCRRVFDSTDDEYQNAPTDGKEKESNMGPEEKAWEDRMEHLGKHYERGEVNVSEEEVDEDLADWGLEVGVLQKVVGGPPRLAASSGGIGDASESSRQSHGRKRSRNQINDVDERSDGKRPRQQPVRRTRYTSEQSDEDVSNDEEEAIELRRPVSAVEHGSVGESDSDAEAEDE